MRQLCPIDIEVDADGGDGAVAPARLCVVLCRPAAAGQRDVKWRDAVAQSGYAWFRDEKVSVD